MGDFCNYYHSSKRKLRQVCDYYTVERKNEGFFFDGDEQKFIKYFALTDDFCTVENWGIGKWDKDNAHLWGADQRPKRNSETMFSLTGPLIGFLGGEHHEFEFNPNNHVQFIIDEYIQWIVFFEYRVRPISDFRFSTLIAILKKVLATPKGRHPLQMETAKKLEQGLLFNQTAFSSDIKFVIAMGEQVFNEGKWLVPNISNPHKYRFDYDVYFLGPGEQWINQFTKEYVAKKESQ